MNRQIISTAPNSNGLGQFDVIDNIFSFATGLFSKDPNKVEFDRVRQEAFDSMVIIQQHVDDEIASGTITRTRLQKYIDAMTQLMNGFKAYADKMRTIVDSTWIDPRFHDYYDVMRGMRDSWQNMLATMPADYIGTVQDFFGYGDPVNVPDSPFGDPNTGIVPTVRPAGMDTTSMLLIGGVVLGLVFMSKRKRG